MLVFFQMIQLVIDISFGATRTFRIKNKKTGEKVKDIPMIQGELLHMGGDFQKEFTHEIPTEKTVKKKEDTHLHSENI